MFNTEPETRCGFYINKDRKLLWEVELKVFSEFQKICEENNLTYFLIGGSAIGAVRHQGFIPWDDDLDIGMPRADFEKLLTLKDEFPQTIHLQYGLDVEKKEFHHFCRLRDVNSTGIIREQYKRKCVHGIFIELYPFDNVPANRCLRKIQWSISHALIEIMYNRVYLEKIEGKAKYIDVLLKPIPTLPIFSIWRFVCSFFNRFKTKMVDTVSLPNYSPSEVDFFFAEDIKDTYIVKFEDVHVCLPIGNDRCLRKTYGDYMQLPPVEKRGTHHNTEVLYDPHKKYTEYSMEDVERYFTQRLLQK